MKRNKLGYIYKVLDKFGNFYIGKRISNKEPLEDPYMGLPQMATFHHFTK